MNSLRRLAVSALVATTLACPALAQTGGPDLQSLHDALHLNTGQEDAWRTFQAAAFDPDEAARQQNAAMMMPTLTAPRRADLSIALVQAELDTLERRAAAVKAFYAVLTPTQQAVFDQKTAPQARPDPQ